MHMMQNRSLSTIDENVDTGGSDDIFWGIFDTAREAYLRRHGDKKTGWCRVLGGDR